MTVQADLEWHFATDGRWRTGRQIQQRLAMWSLLTINTYLRRMERGGAIEARYRPVPRRTHLTLCEYRRRPA